MNEEPAADSLPLPAPRNAPEATWLRALNLMRTNLKATLLPLAVTQLPFALATAAAFFYLFYGPYPEAEFSSFNWLSEAPNGLRLTMVLLGAGQSLFSLVGAAATMVTVSGLLAGKATKLSEALDPAFTRMGGLLIFGVMFNLLLIASFVGFFVLIYFVIRFGVTLQAYVLEGARPLEAIGQSWRLLRGRMLSFAALLLTAIPIAVLMLLATTFVFGIAVAPFGSDPGRTAELAFQSIAIFVVGVSFVPIGAYVATSTTMFYLSAKEQSRA